MLRPSLGTVVAGSHFFEDGVSGDFGVPHVESDVDAVVVDVFCVLEDFCVGGCIFVCCTEAEGFAEEVQEVVVHIVVGGHCGGKMRDDERRGERKRLVTRVMKYTSTCTANGAP